MPQVPPLAPIQIFDSALNFVAEVDTYESLTHTRGWNAPGSFAIKINWNITDDTGLIRYAALFAIGGFITIGNDGTKCGLITAIDKPIGPDGKLSQAITVSGYEPTIIFNRRKLDVPSGSDVYTLNGAAETVIKTAISAQAGPTATNTKRAFSLLSIATDQARGTAYLMSAAYTELLSELTNCSIATKCGFFITLDRVNKLLVLDCALGTDRTAGQNPAAIFSTDYDTLQSADYLNTDEQFKNLATVAGAGTGQLRTVLDVFTAPEPADMARYETFVNANNLTSTPDLTSKGNQQLDAYSYQKVLTGKILAKSQLVYQTDYNLGDFVTVAAYDYSQNVQITAITESWSALQYDIQPQFDKAPPTIGNQIANSAKNLGAAIGNLGTVQSEYLYNSQASINTNDTTSFATGANGTAILANTATTFYDVHPASILAGDMFRLELRDKTTLNWVDAGMALDNGLSAGQYVALGATNYPPAGTATGCGITNSGLSTTIRVVFNGQAYSIAGVGNRSWSQVVSNSFDRWRIRRISFS